VFFVKGDAESLSFDPGRFDVVINIESSHCYGSMETFLANVRRVLRYGGCFLYADFRNKNNVAVLQRPNGTFGYEDSQKGRYYPQCCQVIGFGQCKQTSPYPSFFPDWLLKPFQEFAGVKGSKIYSGFQNGTLIYLHYVLQKNYRPKSAWFA
jgi:SAM-dependent methyltransferase